MKTGVNNMINNIKDIDILQMTQPFIQTVTSIPTKKLIEYISYFIIFAISINSLMNTKKYIIDNDQQKTKNIIIHASISLLLLWTAIYFLVR